MTNRAALVERGKVDQKMQSQSVLEGPLKYEERDMKCSGRSFILSPDRNLSSTQRMRHRTNNNSLQSSQNNLRIAEIDVE